MSDTRPTEQDAREQAARDWDGSPDPNKTDREGYIERMAPRILRSWALMEAALAPKGETV